MRSTTRSRSVATVLALVLAVESVSAVAAAAVTATGRQPAGDVAARLQSANAVLGAVQAATSASAGLAAARLQVAVVDDVPGDGRTVVSVPVPAPTPTPPPAPAPPKPRPQAAAPAAPASPRYAGRNHVWAPAFGINHSVHAFPCSRSTRPGNVVYRWGCAGRNNVYLFGHAANVFSGLHRAYLRKTIKVGQKVWYADGSGKVRAYAVKWWKLVAPNTNPDGIYSALSTPSLTLQTCVGRNSEYRLIVRLVQVKG